MTQTNARVRAESGLNFDIEPNAIIRPRGREIARVIKKIFSVSPNPTSRSSVISKN